MASYWPPKRATAYIIYIALESVATAGTFQSNPTLAAGDFKVSLDGGSLVNLTTLPTVTPASGKTVKISLSSAEMTADNVTIVCSDAAGNEWKDLVISLATVANQNDDLLTQGTGTNQISLSSGLVTLAGVTHTNAVIPTVTNLTNAPTNGDLTTAMKASVMAAVPTSSAIATAVWDALTSALTTVGSIGKLIVTNLDLAISSRMATFSYTTPPTAVQNRQEMDANSTKLDVAVSTRLPTSSYTAPTTPPTVTAIRQEIDANSTKLDVAVSTRLPTSSYVAPTTPPTAVAIRQEIDTSSTQLAKLGTPVHGSLADDIANISGGGGGGGSTAEDNWTYGDRTLTSYGPAGGTPYTYTLRDSITNAPVANAVIWIAADQTIANVVWYGVTDAFGVARDVNGNVPKLTPGTYYILARRIGFTDAIDMEVIT